MIEHSQNDTYPEVYLEALENCKALAVNLLQKALTGEDVKRCWDCSSWVGRCLIGRFNVIARSEACSDFSSKQKNGEGNAEKTAQ
jgi:hypothetical protein